MEAAHSPEMLVHLQDYTASHSRRLVLLLVTAFKTSDFTVMGWISGQILGRAVPVSHPKDSDNQLCMN